ncbi:MAG: hypothetical protein NTW74_20950 [Acidobacteria bacterium]|nr:hypothetical protein [Acidobacteriota bacterium]
MAWEGSQVRPETVYYRIERPVDDVRRYQRLTARNVYRGIDLVFYFDKGRLEYDFQVQPGVDPALIQLKFLSAQTVLLQANGDFSSRIGAEAWLQRAPVVYQETSRGRQIVSSNWLSLGNQHFQFQASKYDKRLPLTVDPVLEFASYLGGEGDEEIVTIGEGYVAGHTASNFIDGGNGVSRKGRDIFFRTQASPNQNPILTANWRDKLFILGGSGDDTLAGASLGLSQDAIFLFFAGTTNSQDIPFTTLSTYRGGASDAFVASYTFRLNAPPSLQNPIFVGSYFGGSGADRANSFVQSAGSFQIAGSTDSTDLPVRGAFQASPGGGRDGFFASIANSSDATILTASYFGGPGDDEVFHLQALGNSFVMMGETGSNEVNGLPGSLKGESDGFLIEFGPRFSLATNTLIESPQIIRGFRFGGSGVDRIKAGTTTLTSFLLVGETTSTDFPTLRPGQASLAGGRDVVLIEISRESGELTRSTYFGGSGDERVHSIASNSVADLLIAGDSNSSDLPVQDALQSTNKGGIDGFYAYFNASFAAQTVSYLGGSGEDSIRSAFIPLSGPFRLGASTNSTDMPEKSAWQAGNSGGIDAFVAEVSLPIFAVPDQVWAGRGLRTIFSVRPSQPLAGRSVTARIENPSLAGFVVGEIRAAEITLGENPSFSLEGLSDQGETRIFITAPGYSPREIKVRVGKSVYFLNSAPTELTPFNAPVEVRYAFSILDPDKNEPVVPVNYSLSLPFPTPPITWRSSNPAIFRVDVNPFNPTIGLVIPSAVGEARVEIVSNIGFWPEGGLPIRISPPRLRSFPARVVASPLTRSSISYQLVLPFSITPNVSQFRPAGKFRVESEDPSLLLVSFGVTNFTGSAETEVVSSNVFGAIGVQLKALKTEGSVRVRLSSSSLEEDVYTTVDLQRLVLNTSLSGSFPASDSIQAPPGTRAFLQSSLRLEDGSPQTLDPLNNPPTIVRIESSNPNIAAPTASTWNIANSASTSPQIEIKSPGSAEIRFISDTTNLRIGNSVRIQAQTNLPSPFRPTTSTRTIGRGLAAVFQLDPIHPLDSSAQVEVISDNPDLVQFATGANASTSPSIRLTQTGRVSFNAVGVGSSGNTTIRVRIQNYQDTLIPVRLGPAGFAFSDARLVVDVSERAATVSIAPYALDPDSLEPLEAQFAWSTTPAVLNFSANSSDLTLSRNTCSISRNSGSCTATLGWTAPGEFTLALDPVGGYSVPTFRQALRIRVNKTALANLFWSAITDCLTSVTVQTFFSFAGTNNYINRSVKVTSLEPEKLVFSTSPSAAGQSSIDTLTNSPIYLHGLAIPSANGLTTARVRLEGVGIDTVELTVPIYNWTLALNRGFTQISPASTILQGSEIGYTISLVSTAGNSAFGTRPGIAPIQFNTQISDPALLSVKLQAGVEANFPPGVASRETIFTGLGVGSVQVTAVSGARIGSSLKLDVRLPRLLARPIVAGRDSRSVIQLQLEAGASAPKDNTLFNIRSLDPSKLLVQSAIDSSPGQASVTTLWPVNSNSVNFNLDSLAGEGEARVEVTLPGYEVFRTPVYFAPLGLSFSSIVSVDSLSVVAGAESSWSIEVFPSIRSELSGIPEITYPGFAFRPGFDPANIPVTLESDNPSVVAVIRPAPVITNSGRSSFTFRGVSAGTATLRVLPPEGFATLPAARSSLLIRVEEPKLNVSCAIPVHYEASVPCSISVPRDVRLTIRSSNPNRLQVASGQTLPGQTEINTPVGPNFVTIYLHSLARSGSTDLTISAPGYAPQISVVTHLESAFFITPALSGNATINLGVSSELNTTVEFFAVSADGRPNGSSIHALRPGAFPVTVPIRVSDPSLLSVTPASVIFQPGERSKQILLKGLKSGSLTIEPATPAGFAAPTPAAVLVRIN